MTLYKKTRGLLAAHSIRPSKALGQHFLVDEAVLDEIIEAAELEPSETVVEIGGGVGALTHALARRAAAVHCIEIDPALVAVLEEALAGLPNVAVHQADALKFPLETLPAPYSVVANIPYQITAPLVGRLIAEKGRLRRATLTIQLEVARRLCAQPGSKDYGVLSLVVAYHFEARRRTVVPARAFWPVPKVDSAVVSLSPRQAPPVDVGGAEEGFLALIKQAFSQRRKTLRNNLKALKGGGWSAGTVAQALEAAGVDGSRRAETLSLEEFAALWRAFQRASSGGS